MAGRPAYLRGRGRGRGQNVTLPRVLPAVNNNTVNRNRLAMNDTNNSHQLHAEEKFIAATNQHRAAAMKHLEQVQGDDMSSGSDSDDINDAMMDCIFKSYIIKDVAETEDLSKVQDDLLHNFRSSTSACLICIESIRKEDAIWNCQGCYCMFHITCIQKWVREGVSLEVYQSENKLREADIPWHCPKCRREHTQTECPTRYYCFCGKRTDPRFDPWLVAHSCGETCGKRLKQDCGHECRLLCHPGPCPPCPQMVQVTCYCHKEAPRPRRCSARAWSCSAPCGKLLTCGQHNCPQPCHPGECPPCPKTSVQSCECGRNTSKRPCADTLWHCDQVCGRPLSCGQHLCESICHKGDCGPCPRAGVRLCPCGKTEFELPCTEDVPTCGDTCGQPLGCGRHFCERRCHPGDCGVCRALTRKRCRCGQKLREVLCSKEYFCDSRCSRLRDCGNHQCKRKCCDGIGCPRCEQVCNKPLSCRNHKCSSPCHRGPCYVCPLTVDIACFCGKTKVNVPCGKEKTTKPPRCHQKCQISPDCHHPASKPHRCHFGRCPPCSYTCGLELLNCNHTCPDRCHSATRRRHCEVVAQRGPWDKKVVETVEVVNVPCSACLVPVTIQCHGNHEEKEMACSQQERYSCTRPCNRQLDCTNHTCSVPCHPLNNDSSNPGGECETCEAPCTLPRPPGCTHACPSACHAAPCDPCRQTIRMRCHCHNIVKHVECDAWFGASDEERVRIMCCQGVCHRNLPCGHMCGATCHPGVCPRTDKCEKRVAVRCPCRRKKKDFVCHQVISGVVSFACDDACEREKTAKKQAEEELVKQKEAAELEKRLAELDEYERRTQPGRRPKRHRKEYVPPPPPSLWRRYGRATCVVTSIVAIVAFLVYLFYDEF